MKRVQGLIGALLLVNLLFSLAASEAQGDEQSQAIRLFDRLAGVPIRLNDMRLSQMTAAIRAGNLKAAAMIATADDNFYNITVKHFATPMSNKEEDYQRPLNDFIATVIGVTRDQLDARSLLNGDFVYQGSATLVSSAIKFMNVDLTLQSEPVLLLSNTHYARMEGSRTNLRQALISVPQRVYAGNPSQTTDNVTTFNAAIAHPDAAGLLTTRQWAEQHIEMGTNRRPIQYAFDVFLCKKNTETRDSSANESRVRRDVDRMPAGVAATYQSSCRGCHAPMDALSGAYAFYEYIPNGNDGYMRYTAGTVQGKMNKNSAVFANGYRVTNNSWVNYYNQNQNAALGWSSSVPQSGNGVKGVGNMIANSNAFSSCMATRVFTEVCRRSPAASESNVIQGLAANFVSSGYKLKSLFEDAAIHNECLGN